MVLIALPRAKHGCHSATDLAIWRLTVVASCRILTRLAMSIACAEICQAMIAPMIYEMKAKSHPLIHLPYDKWGSDAECYIKIYQ
jgi:hypothetical protein